ncbi:hypothetical protein Plhal304r1_c008g0033321 [Plasmopara halstedii]
MKSHVYSPFRAGMRVLSANVWVMCSSRKTGGRLSGMYTKISIRMRQIRKL